MLRYNGNTAGPIKGKPVNALTSRRFPQPNPSTILKCFFSSLTVAARNGHSQDESDWNGL